MAIKFINKCYKCKYRGEVPSSAHSSCNHPDAASDKEDPFNNIMAILASVGRIQPVNIGIEKLNIKGNARGIKGGWFNWPFSFDPVWLENCSGFKAKENK